MHDDRPFLPAAGRDAFLPLYDPFTRLFGFMRALDQLIAGAELRPSHEILDIGCGTGTLAVRVVQRYPGVRVTGVDPDPKALARAAKKAARAGVSVRFERGFADALQYRNDSFDRVFSSMMLHHVHRREKPKALGEMRRVLKPDGRLELMDLVMHGHRGLLARLLHGKGQLSANADDRIMAMLREAGFPEVTKTGERQTLFGPIGYYRGARTSADS
jgi:ubiquinone/menaquinone biosynthesis C-methylase UbiE